MMMCHARHAGIGFIVIATPYLISWLPQEIASCSCCEHLLLLQMRSTCSLLVKLKSDLATEADLAVNANHEHAKKGEVGLSLARLLSFCSK
jgi:hypothetical protein